MDEAILNLLTYAGILLFLMCMGIYFWFKRPSRLQPSSHEKNFFKKTGFRMEGAPDNTVNTSVRMIQALALQGNEGRTPIRMIRNYHGLPIIHHSSTTTTGALTSTRLEITSHWTAKVDSRGLNFHVADRFLMKEPGRIGARSITVEIRSFRNLSTQASIVSASPGKRLEDDGAYEIQTGRPNFDQRFIVWGNDKTRIKSMLLHPGVIEALEACPEVDLWVDDQGILYNDPAQNNSFAELGGFTGFIDAGYMIFSRPEMAEAYIRAQDTACLAILKIVEIVTE